MSGRLEGKSAVVTGSSRGIGRAIAAAFIAEGARVIVNSRDPDAARAAAAELGEAAHGVGADVSSPAGAAALVEAALERFGRLDVMVANAGVNAVEDAVTLAPEDWERVIGVNLSGVFYCAQAAGRAMLERGSGSVVAIASVTSFNAFPRRVAYSTAKAGVAQMTKVLASEWAPAVRVNAVAPGYVRTDLVEGLAREGKVDIAAIERRTPMHRLGGVEEIAKAVLFLVSGEASYITGQTLLVDGGWVAYGFV